MITVNLARLLPALMFVSALAVAHPGGVDANGGHTNRSTGKYHCHKEKCHTPGDVHYAEASESSVRLYERSEWPHWVDHDNDCQDARAEALISSSLVPVKYKRNRGCVVTWGKWIDPYSGQEFNKASDLDIDHIVSLKHAHGHGAQNWTRERRREFANDPKNLIVVSASENRSKGSKSPDQWMPSNVQYHCEYLSRWMEVKKHYGLYMTLQEKEFIARSASQCKLH